MATKDEAARFLGDTSSEQGFWLNSGPVLKNLEELSNALPQISGEVYGYHVNAEKNDFSKWVNDIIGDKKLANDLLSSRNKESAAKKVAARVSSLKKKAGN